MNATDSVLSLLRQGQVLSGEEIARRLGVSRNTVWKAVEKLRKAGYQIEAGTNRGYSLVSESGVLSAENIRRYLGRGMESLRLDVRESVSSTNTVLKELAEKGAQEGLVVFTESQDQGKGRLGRSFHSPKGTGLYMSVLLRPDCQAEESLAITTAAAVAVAGAVSQVTGVQAQIKWVNDVYLYDKKICGILTEAALDFESGRLNYAVLGIGVNIQEPPEGFPPELKEVAGAIFQGEAPAEARSRLAAEILTRFFGFYREFPRRTYMDEYRRRSLLTGLQITFQRGQESWEGRVLGVDDEAHLMVRLSDNGEVKTFSAGEVTVVKEEMFRQLRDRAETLGANNRNSME